MKDVFEGAAYEFRVSAINLSGGGDPSIPCDTVIARDPMSKPVTLSDTHGLILRKVCACKGVWKRHCTRRVMINNPLFGISEHQDLKVL